MREMSEEGKAFIKRREALLLVPTYDKIGGVWNIGFGHVYKDDEPRVPITVDEAHALFDIDIHYRNDFVDSVITSDVSQPMYDACNSLNYNIGTEAFERSSVLAFVNMEQWQDACISFLLFRKSKGQVVDGLINRRSKEMIMFAEGIYLP